MAPYVLHAALDREATELHRSMAPFTNA